jgi:hypothetical protein
MRFGKLTFDIYKLVLFVLVEIEIPWQSHQRGEQIHGSLKEKLGNPNKQLSIL